jgi:PAS domain S-box-containing protein
VHLRPLEITWLKNPYVRISLEHSKAGVLPVYRVISFIIFLQLCFLTIYNANAFSQHHVLVLNSYHLGYKWSDDLLDGIRSEMGKNKKIMLYTEFLDTKRIFDDKTFNRFSRYLKDKYKRKKFDLIITSDDNAFVFIKKYRTQLFSNIPVVFCGVNYYKKSDTIGFRNVTGVNEKTDIYENVQLILKLHPNTNLIVFICDNTATGKKIQKHIQSLQPSIEHHHVKTNLCYDISMKNLIDKIKWLPKESIIFFTTFSKDNTGTYFEYDQSISLIARNALVPIYGAWDIYLGHGIIGGKLVSGYDQGETAANLGLRILAGEPADSIPVITKSPNRFMFDMDQLQRFGIQVSQLPESSKIIYPTIRFNYIIIISILCIGFLSFVIIFLLFNNVKRKIAEKKLKVTLDHLEQRVIDRTEEVSLANKKLRKQQEFLRNVIDTDPNFIFVKNREDQFVLANQAMADLCGTSVENLVGKKVSEFNPNKEEVNQYFIDNEAVMTSLQPKFIPEQQFTTSSGKVHYIQIIKKPLISDDGIADKVLCVATDITDRKKVEKEVETSRSIAESSNRAKSEFLANMSHELRTPLHGILGYTQILQRNEALMAEIGIAVNIIHRSGEHLLMMINDILDLSKIEAHKQELREAEIYIPGFLETIVEIIRVRASQQQIGFVIHIDENIPTGIVGDETRLRQILLNLLGNAVKFTQKGEVRFTVNQSGPGLLHFKIEDTGIGIPEDKMDEIFLPFHQVVNNIIQTEGTGLGLAICNKLLKIMNSELNVSSTLGKGSCFEFYLPVKEIALSSDIIAPKNQKIVGYDGRNIKILVCDDQKTNRDVLSQLLIDIGFDVVEAVDGRDGLEKALAHHPDIILMDLMMPEMDGYIATRALRNMPEIKDTAVIAISAGVFNQTRQDCLDAGCDDFIPKPVITDELLEKISKHLSLKWQYAKAQTLHNGQVLNQAIVPPPKHVLEQYKKLVMAGRVTEIQRQLKILVHNDPKYIPFSEHIKQLAYDFRNDDIQSFIDQFQNNDK